jgi:hypothetical protein
MLEQNIQSHRITIILDDETLKKLRKRQARLLMKTSQTVTLTKVIKDSLNEFLNNS